MARNNRAAASTLLLCLIVVSASVPASECFERPACGACKKIAKLLHNQAKDKQAQIPPQNITKKEIVRITTNNCNLQEEEEKDADSTRKIDTVEKGDKLKLADKGAEVICDAECKTMREACNEVMKGADRVSNFLNEHDADPVRIEHYVCEELTTPCDTKHAPAAERTPEALRPGEADEDKDEDTDLASKPGKVLKDEESRKGDWKQKLTEGIKTSGEVLKRHVGKASRPVREWWRGVTKPGSKKNSETDKSEEL